jgi:hypothetical protein
MQRRQLHKLLYPASNLGTNLRGLAKVTAVYDAMSDYGQLALQTPTCGSQSH